MTHIVCQSIHASQIQYGQVVPSLPPSRHQLYHFPWYNECNDNNPKGGITVGAGSAAAAAAAAGVTAKGANVRLLRRRVLFTRTGV